MGLQSLGGRSLSFCSIITPTHLLSRTNYGSKVWGLGWCSSLFIGNLLGLQEITILGSIFPTAWSHTNVTLRGCWEFPSSQTSSLSQWCALTSLIPVLFPSTLTFCPPFTWSLLLSPLPPLSSYIPSSTPDILLFPLLREIQASSLGYSLLRIFFGSVVSNMVI